MADQKLIDAVEALGVEQVKYRELADRYGDLETKYNNFRQKVMTAPPPTTKAEAAARANELIILKSGAEALRREKEAVDKAAAEVESLTVAANEALADEPYIAIPGYDNPDWPPEE